MSVAQHEDVNPPYLHPAYEITVQRAPSKRLIEVPRHFFHHSRGPVWGRVPVRPGDNDLTRQHAGRPVGQTITLTGRVLDSDGRGVAGTLVEIWQTNASGAYLDPADPGFMSLDPNFTGAGRCLTDGDGRYRFVTVRPGAYPWRNHPNAWRPAHIHFSLLGRELSTRLVTQMYFPGDPLHDADPIMQAVRDPRARASMISSFDWEATMPEWALGFRFDIVLGGARATPTEDE